MHTVLSACCGRRLTASPSAVLTRRLGVLQGLPAAAVTYSLVAHVWLQWRTAQDRRLICLGGPLVAAQGAVIEEHGGEMPQGGLTVVQWGAAPNGRIERQLRGRAGRQGDPGESHALVSIEDESIFRGFSSVQSLVDM